MKNVSLRTRLALSVAIFLLAFGVRILSWHDTRLEVGKVQTAVTGDYKRVAQLLRDEGLRGFFSPSSPLADPNNLGHPPGYSIVLASVYSFISPTDTAAQIVQILCDSAAAIVIFLIVAELLSAGAAVTAGLLAALAPQFAWNSVLLLPDSLSVLPILLAIYLIARAAKNGRLLAFLAAGIFVGVSCWLRANVMLLTLFVAAAAALLKSPANFSLSKPREDDKLKFVGRRWRPALAVVFGTLLIVLPLTIRNAIVFRRFIPLSLGAGQTLLEGIADYDRENRFGIPSTDMGIMKQEAEIYQRPDYYGTLFNPDGVERERARLSRGWAVIRSHPFWFAGVMARRASSMVRLERVRLISTEPPVSHTLDASAAPVWLKTPEDMLMTGAAISPQVQTSVMPGPSTMPDTESWLTIIGDGSNYGDQFALPIGAAKENVDYQVNLPLRIASGRVRIKVQNSSGKIYSSAIVEALETVAPDDQPWQQISLPLVTRASDQLQIVLSNEASNPPHPSVRLGVVRLFELGPARFLWTRYPRFVIHGVQKRFITAVILPLAIIGLLILIFQKQSRALVILSIVPVYFFLVQSIVHTEYRYVLAVDYFMFALVGVALSTFGALLVKPLSRVIKH